MADGRLENDHDVEQILKLAVRGAGFTDEEALRQRLRAAGSELGLSDAQLVAAEKQYLKDKDREKLRKEFESEARQELWEHVGTYLVVNAGLVGLNFMTSGHLSWALWSVLGWGIGVGCHVVSFYFPGKREYDKEFEKWQRKRDRRDRRRGRRGLVIGVNINGSGILSDEEEEEEETVGS